MPRMKTKDIREMSREEREKKLKDLKLEIIKSKASAQKTGNSKAKEIRKIIAKILTINTQTEKKSKQVLKTK